MREIKVRNQNGSLMSRFTVEGQGYTLSYGSKDLTRCEAIAAGIRLDIEQGEFDRTLEKYRNGGRQVSKPLKPLAEMWQMWVNSLDISEGAITSHYSPILSRIPSSAKVGETKWLLEASKRWSGDTWNSRIGRVKAFGEWLKEESYLPVNPYRGLKRKDSEREEYVPFTVEEMIKILDHIKVKKPEIERFYRFLFLTGCRPAEAIGLRWTDINNFDGYITINSALARSPSGSASPGNRVRKSTKTKTSRVICLSDELKELFTECRNSTPLVFVSSRGNSIDDRNALNRVWQPTLEELGIPYRVPYNARHTAASELLGQGVPAIEVAKTLGTSMNMLDRHYGHLRPGNLPKVGYTLKPETVT